MTPNPGSDKAIEQGCSCCAEVNRHGKGIAFAHSRKGDWWIDFLCPLHGRNTRFGGVVGRKEQPPRKPEPQSVDPWTHRRP